MASTNFDVIVLGAGGVGSAALFHLACRGVSVLGIDQFTPGHDLGSSHGQTRIIRQAYFEHPDYVPLVRRAFELWQELELLSGEKLYTEVGLLQIGPAQGEVISGVRASARQHHLEIENLTPRESMARFPGFRVPEDCDAVFEKRAGYLAVEQCVIAHAREAVRLGATLNTSETVREWRIDGPRVSVKTDRDTYQAEKLVIGAGAWSAQLLGDLGVSLEVRRKPLYWWRTKSGIYRPEAGCPAYLYELPHGVFYGVPQIDQLGVKVAEHTGGAIVSDPFKINRELESVDQSRVAEFVGQFMPDATTERTHFTVCMYTMTSDAHFIVDRHPAAPRVVFAAGLSGHGFKFTGVLGEALADLALEGRTDLPIGFLSAARPALKRDC